MHPMSCAGTDRQTCCFLLSSSAETTFELEMCILWHTEWGLSAGLRHQTSSSDARAAALLFAIAVWTTGL